MLRIWVDRKEKELYYTNVSNTQRGGEKMVFNKLKGKMTEEGMSQEKLSRELGITVQALNAKLNGRSQFTLAEVVKITSVLLIEDPIDIFFNQNVPNMQQKAKSEIKKKYAKAEEKSQENHGQSVQHTHY